MTVGGGSIEVVGFQGEPPSSDDEDDIPLSTVVASKTVTLGHGYAPAYSTIPQRLPARTTPKRPLSVQPMIWAQSRQEVCESFDWFRSYQGGVYFNNDMVKGYLLGKHPSSRDRFLHDGRLIISHGGGKAESVHSKHGHSELLAAADQRENDKSIRALLRTYQMGRPLVLIIDDQYEPFPFDLASKGVSYAVLGFYHIAHAWAEREPEKTAGTGFVVRYKFAFEWCEKQPPPWWLQQAPPAPVARAPSPAIVCTKCHKASPRVFQDEWMCLQPDCPVFWRGPDGMAASPDGPTYHPSFLELSLRCDHEPMEDIAPLPPATEAADGVITSHRFCKGWHCKRCGRLSCRFKWEHWECRGCGAIVQVTGKIRIPQEFWCQPTPTFMHHKISPGSGITASTLCPYKVDDSHFGHYHIYTLPENRGRIYLILGGHFINNTANKIFQDYQNQAASGKLPFRRWPLRAHKCRGPFLTHYFSQNSRQTGATQLTYCKYVGGTDNTMPFAKGLASTDARNLIQERMQNVMQDECGQYVFNEVLSAAYMEKQQMAGDVLIMDGAEIQEYYEHTVVPVNFRIAATARYIAPH
ncbi:hypothetical protein BD413DRAFT_484945 [Trametes elegans]|nr:hypothetical protein BD413DRAFT_484945 [Trametes elegans]